MKKAFLLLSLLLFSQCSLLNRPENNDGDTALALLLGISAGCVIGGQAFTPSAGVTCSGGTASGTGTLTATTEKDDLAIRVFPTIEPGGSISIFALSDGTTPSTGVMSVITPGFTMSNGNNLQAFSINFTSSICYEVHGHEGHVFAKADSSCSGPRSGDADFSGSFAEAGESWGFVLDDATISGLTVYGSPGLSH